MDKWLKKIGQNWLKVMKKVKINLKLVKIYFGQNRNIYFLYIYILIF